MRIVSACLLAVVFAQSASAQALIKLNTGGKDAAVWTVYETVHGMAVPGSPVPIGPTQYGNIPGFTIPFTDNDGYWYADTTFTLPAGFSKPVLHIEGLGVDDRAVVELNGHIVTSSGTLNGGAGFMAFLDGGVNKPFNFPYASGAEAVKFKKGFVTGINDLRIIVNNTLEGILGTQRPPHPGDDTNVGLLAHVTYAPPAASAVPSSLVQGLR